jgi:hypothetical protein
VTDQLSLSIWLELGRREPQRQRFESMLRLFPFSQREAQPQTTVVIRAIDSTEPPLLERPMNGPASIDEIVGVLNDYSGNDIAYEVQSFWDLWQFDVDWNLSPTRVLLSSFGAQFDNGSSEVAEDQEDLRIDFGVDMHFLPQPEIAGSARLVESNIKSLLRLVHEMENQLSVRKRLLSSESGENFAERLQRILPADSSTH